MPTARTSGSAHLSSTSASGGLLAAARAAAAIVAVAPTVVARSHPSPLLRTMPITFPLHISCLHFGHRYRPNGDLRHPANALLRLEIVAARQCQSRTYPRR